MLAARARVAARYREALADLDGLVLPCPDSDGDERGWFVFVVQLPEGVDRDATVRALAEQGIQSKPYLPAIHLMSFYRERFGFAAGEFPTCEAVAARSLALPFFPDMPDRDVYRVAQALRAATNSPLKINPPPPPQTRDGGGNRQRVQCCLGPSQQA